MLINEEKIIIIDSKSGNTAQIAPKKGAMLQELMLNKQSIIQTKVFDIESKVGYPSAFLFPFPNRIEDGKYTFQGIDYQLPITEPQHNNAIHGLIAFSEFEVVSSSDSTLKLKYTYQANFDYYPFSFDFEVLFSITESAFILNYSASNTGTQDMPCAFGWHPYFQISGENIDNLTLKISEGQNLALNERNLPEKTEEAKNCISEIDLNQKQYDHLYKINQIGTEIAKAELSNAQNKICIEYQSNSSETYLMIYTPPSRNCIAIEPQTANINCFNNLEGLSVLKPNEKLEGEIRISVR